MSIVASVKVHDGIALGSDSATQISGKDPQGNIVVLKTYENARKLFRFQEFPVGILAYGIGNIGNKSIQTILREFDKSNSHQNHKEKFKVETLANSILEFIRSIHDQIYGDLEPEKKPRLGIFIAGYSVNESIGEEWEFVIPNDSKARLVRPQENFGSSWRGVVNPFTRLYFGHDTRIIEELVQAGVKRDLLDKILKKFSAGMIYDGMPLSTAVDFVKFILATTIGLTSFEIGPPSCSEPIQVAVITEQEFKWIVKPTLEE